MKRNKTQIQNEIDKIKTSAIEAFKREPEVQAKRKLYLDIIQPQIEVLEKELIDVQK